MNRREWLHRAALVAGTALAADQIELIERLTPRRYVGGANLVTGSEHYGTTWTLLDQHGRPLRVPESPWTRYGNGVFLARPA